RGPEAPPGETITVKVEPNDFWSLLQSVIGPVMEFLIKAGMILILVVFMVIKREDLRNRLIRIWGRWSLTRMTQALDDASRRISRFLLMQLLVNGTFGLVFGVGLFLIGVPYAFLWGFFAALLRYIPFLGA